MGKVATAKRSAGKAVRPARRASADEPRTRPADGSRAAGAVDWLVVRGATQNNLQNIDAYFPLGRFTCVTGVSGSGKSSLVNDILYAALAQRLIVGSTSTPGAHAGIEGWEALDKVIAIDQTPIGRTPRSNPATYIKLFGEIRDLYTRLPDARLRGYKPGRFSFNVPTGARGGGRCEACEGNGSNRIEMDFLADVWVPCPLCGGKRFGRETLQVLYKGKSIADVLELDVAAALELFDSHPRIHAMLRTLHDVGLDYLRLGQSSTTLSGGEAQRIKLARELVKRATGRTLYVLDEPTTGLHFEDIRKLLEVLHGFVEAGNTVVVIEHNLDVIKTADWLIDLGPEGGAGGGRILATGTPEDVAEVAASYTGAALREVLGEHTGSGAAPARRDGRASGGAVDAPRRAATLTSEITVVGARQHNLKDVTISFPRDALTVCTGVSGSGKTSFAIDTVFTEGYRRYVESLSAYARQFLGQLQKPRVEHVEGLSPAICIEQKAASKSPRSTVGTITEIYDYLRVLWARVGTRFCPTCDVPIGSQTAEEIVARVLALPEGTPIILLAPIALGDGETYAALFNRLKASGYTRVRINGVIQMTTHATTLDARRRQRIEVVVDRTVVRAKARGRIAESVEHALALGNGVMTLVVEAQDADPAEATASEATASGAAASGAAAGAPVTDAPAPETAVVSAEAPREAAVESPPRRAAGREFLFSQRLACSACGTSYADLGPNHFSFNGHLGWCETCEGLGVQRGAPPGAIIKRPARGLLDGALDGWPSVEPTSDLGRMLTALCQRLDLAPETPLADWTPAQKNALLFGLPNVWLSAPELDRTLGPLRFAWRGLFPTLDSVTRNSWSLRLRLQANITDIPCLGCRGGRLRPDAAAVRLLADEAAGGPARRGSPPGEAPLHQPTLVELCNRPLGEVREFFRTLRLPPTQRTIAGEVLKEINDRLQFLVDVGLEYLTLHRAAPTLSGGEAQRIRLASQIGSGLSGVLYVLDEPTIGLHPRDNRRLIGALTRLRELGNTLLIVEHDRDVIQHADRVLDFGPRAGAQGGRIVARGTPAELRAVTAPPDGASLESAAAATDGDRAGEESLTRAYLSGVAAIPVPTNRRPVGGCAAQSELERGVTIEPCDESGTVLTPPRGRRAARNAVGAAFGKRTAGAVAERPAASEAEAASVAGVPQALVIRGARQNNLKNINAVFPLGRLIAVTGVSGSGKSSLINDILWPVLANRLQRANLSPGEHEGVELLPLDEALALPARATAAARSAGSGRRRAALSRELDKAINVDQSPLGATPLSNPATYTGVFDLVRELFARVPDSKVRGYGPNRFSFNRPGGRCEACEGYGQKCVEMHFMPDVWVPCEVCQGQRYNPETLEVRYRGRTISEVLDARVKEALEIFAQVPKIRRLLQTLADVGLEYVQLGQPAPTLSGGEAQRVKLAAELGKPDTGRTFYILDEPTTGLHFEDVRKLLGVLQRLVDLGNTVVVVEHNLDVIKSADWVIDLGPEAGDAGGEIVAAGTPEDIVERLGTARKTPAAERAAPSARSHTAEALAPILAAGPHETRPVYRREEHIARELAAERGGLGDIGRETRPPWQVDGRKWHLEQRTSRDGQRPRWERAALEFVLELVEAEGRLAAATGKARGFLPVNWNERASVEMTAPGAPVWFLHALTGGEWLLELFFRTPPGTFDAKQLDRELGLKTLDERADLEVYGNWRRVDIRPRLDGYSAVVIYAHDRRELDTPAFRRFVRTAVRAYFAGIVRKPR